MPGAQAHPHVPFADGLTPSRRGTKVQWCAIGRDEKKKCDVWSVMSNGDVECVVADDTKECITKIMVQLFFPSHCELLRCFFCHLSSAKRWPGDAQCVISVPFPCRKVKQMPSAWMEALSTLLACVA